MKATKALPSAPAASAVPGRVSVIVPTRDSSRTIEACLASVCAQSYPDVELVVVDNGSTDGTPDVARPFAHRVLSAGSERSAQRNAGATASTGEFLVFVDSDMLLSPSVVEEVVLVFREDPGLQGLIIPERSRGTGFWARCRILEKELYLARAHCLLVPSVREGWGLVVIEANSVGTPAVAYDVPGVRDSIRQGKTGLLASESNPSSLAEHSLRLVSNRTELALTSELAIEWAQRFSWESSAERILAFIESRSEGSRTQPLEAFAAVNSRRV